MSDAVTPRDQEPTVRVAATVRDLIQQSEERARLEREIETEKQHSDQTNTRAYQKARSEIQQRLDAEYQAAETAYREAKQARESQERSRRQAAKAAFEQSEKSIQSRSRKAIEAAETKFKEKRWEAGTLFETALNSLQTETDKALRTTQEELRLLKEIENATREKLRQWRRAKGFNLPDGSAFETTSLPGDQSEDSPVDQLSRQVDQLDQELSALEKLRLPGLFASVNLIWLYLWVGVLSVIGFSLVLPLPTAIMAGLAASAVISTGLAVWLWYLAARQIQRKVQPMLARFAETRALGEACKGWVQRRHATRLAGLTRTRDGELSRAEITCSLENTQAQAQSSQELQIARAQLARALAEVEQESTARGQEIELTFPPKLVGVARRKQESLDALSAEHEQKLAAAARLQEQRWSKLVQSWDEHLSGARRTIDEAEGQASRLFFDWTNHGPEDWTPTASVPPVLRFGTVRFGIDQVPHGMPTDERLLAAVERTGARELHSPALLRFPARGSLLIRSGEAGRDQAVKVLQATMLRILTAFPPGKARFTIIDPIGLGENFSAFMHLADYDELLVTNRIWTEPQHIEQRLTDLTEHIENVIQKYLRNQFANIEEYNAHAGEVAEPYRFLVIGDFPVNFQESTARRLAGICHSGPKCGVHTLITLDNRLPLPAGFKSTDLEQGSTQLVWKDGRFVWKHDDLGGYPLVLDQPPAAEAMNRLLHKVGATARDANKVQVPFELIAPPEADYWTADSRRGVDVPLGRAGASKLQNLRLGQGTSQHVLIAGKTGSGKSTLLHALITNSALLYAPEELELYLIDFKKGVEFKTYASRRLPHARVIAIESDREFGLSVLQRLDAELKQRAELFRALEVQDLASFRQAQPTQPMPRILLIVDEFQEFFVEDDRIAQEVSLLLDRLVRQGRAFGIHVHLGSQTLSGAYSLARSTLGQMAVRIALQCSESDAHLILSEDNTAARLLTRPGEAIYNDANGLLEGNSLFQIVWLPDDKRDVYLERLRARAEQRGFVPPSPCIVFEGNIPADPAACAPIARLLERPDWPETPRALSAWLGDAIAIKDPTAAVFRPQSGSNLLIIGQFEEKAVALMQVAWLGLAAQLQPTASAGRGDSSNGNGKDKDNRNGGVPRFVILDGTPVDSPMTGAFQRLAGIVPHPSSVVGPREVAAALEQLGQELDQRLAAPDQEHPPIFLLVQGLHQFRDLRKGEDDYGFGRSSYDEAPPSASKRFSNLLAEGPAMRMHTLIWVDTVTSMNRSLDRQSLREFDQKVLFQMSANDSSVLIDAPSASKLGINRALLHSENQSQPEKFRPFGLPEHGWLKQVEAAWKARAEAMQPR